MQAARLKLVIPVPVDPVPAVGVEADVIPLAEDPPVGLKIGHQCFRNFKYH